MSLLLLVAPGIDDLFAPDHIVQPLALATGQKTYRTRNNYR
jgi:hypothetical protein